MPHTLEDLQADLEEIDVNNAISDHLQCAESSETLDDFRANLQEAIDAAISLAAQLKTLKITAM